MFEGYVADVSGMKLSRIGSISFNGDKIHCEGFDSDEATTCRDVAILACQWAAQQDRFADRREQLLAEASAMIAKPGGTGNVGID